MITSLHPAVVLRCEGYRIVKIGQEFLDAGRLVLFGILQFELQPAIIALAIAEDRL
jgi:hypothetical protein